MLKFRNINIIILACLFSLISCQLGNIEIDEWSPELVSPLINTTLTIADLIPEEGSTQYDEDGFIRLAVRDDSVYSLTAESFINIPNQLAFEEEFAFSELEIDDFVQDTVFSLEEIVVAAIENDPDGLLSVVIQQLLELPFPPEQEVVGSAFSYLNESVIDPINFELDDFSSASFLTGQLAIEITNNLPIAIENMEVDISTGEGNVGVGQISNLLFGQTQSMSIDLSGTSIDNNITINFLDLTLENPGSDMVIVTPETGFEISFSITNINVDNVTMSFQNQELQAESTFFDFNLENNEQIHNIVLSNGQINYSINSSLIAPIIIVFSIPSGLINDQIFEVVETIQLNGGTVEGSIDISGLMVDLTTDPEQPFNRVPLEFEVLIDSDSPVTLTNSDYANILFSFSNLTLDYLDGYFSNYNIELGGDTVDVDLALFEDFDSGLILENPTFTINLRNSLGVSAQVIGELIAYSQDGLNQAGFNFNEIIDAPSSVDEEVTLSWVYDQNVIGDIISLPPKTIEYSASASIIDDGVLNFVTNESTLLLGVDIDFPLSINAANISLRDTLLLNPINYDITQIDRLILHFNLINGFPLGTEFNLVLHDSINMINLDTLSFTGVDNENGIIDPAVVDNEGYVTESVLTSGVLSLSSLEISNFLNSNKIIIDIKLTTSNAVQEDQYVKLYSNYECVLKVGIETQLNLN